MAQNKVPAQVNLPIDWQPARVELHRVIGAGAYGLNQAIGKLNDFPSVKDFGAVGDGVTDDTAAIQAAIDAVTTAGGVIFFPTGSYSVSTLTLKSYVHLVGQRRSQMDDIATRGSALLQRGTTGDVISTADHPTSTSSASVEDLAIYGNDSATSGRGIYLSQGTRKCGVMRCTIINCADQGLVNSGLANTVQGNWLGLNVQNNAAGLTYYKGQMEIYGTDHQIVQNEVYGVYTPSPFDGAALSNANLYACAMLVQAASCFISQNICEVSDAGLVLVSRHTSATVAGNRTDPYYPASCHSNSFVQNRADFNLGHGIWLVATNTLAGPYLNEFVGNWVNGCGRNAANTYDGIFLDAVGTGYPRQNLIVGNHIFDSVGATNDLRYGINVAEAMALQDATTYDTVQGNRVDPNSVDTAAYNGVLHNSGTASIASGATTAVVTHGVGTTPTLDDISIVFGEQGTNDYGRFWVSTITSTQFTLNVSADPGASNLDFAWRVDART